MSLCCIVGVEYLGHHNEFVEFELKSIKSLYTYEKRLKMETSQSILLSI